MKTWQVPVLMSLYVPAVLNTYFILFIFFSIVAEEIPEEEVMMETVAAEAIIL